jgi:hypothetical protein
VKGEYQKIDANIFMWIVMFREVAEWGASEVQPMKDIQAVVSAAVEGFAPSESTQ